jgi:hypothetical protein
MTKEPKSNDPTSRNSISAIVTTIVGLITEIYASDQDCPTNEHTTSNEAALVRASKRTAIATVFIAIAGILTFGAAILQWLALSSTDVATRDLATAALRQSTAADKQVTAMQGQLDEMKKQSALTISQLRPKLSLKIGGPKVPMKLGDKEGWVLTPTWQNRGGSEGIDFWGWDNARLFTPDAPADFDFMNLGHDPGPVSKTTIDTTEPRLQLSKVISRDEIQSVMDRKSNFVLWGYIEYRESLPGKQSHHVHWCYGVVPTDAGDSWIFAYPLYRAECNSSD